MVNVAEYRERKAVPATVESKVCVCVWLKRESGSERKGGRWCQQQKRGKWVSMAAGREKRKHEKEKEG